jgi:hypothetical protein
MKVQPISIIRRAEALMARPDQLRLSGPVIRGFWDSQYQIGKWIRLTRIVDWIVSWDRHCRLVRDEMLIDEPARIIYLKLSRAVLLGFFKSQTIMVSPEWYPEGSPDQELAARVPIAVDQFKKASQSSLSADVDSFIRWTAPLADVDGFIRAYLQNMAITNRACADWLSREGYDLPPWLAAGAASPEISLPPQEAPRPISIKDCAKEFKLWRDSCDEIPTIKQDVAHMKGLGVGRDAVLELRKGVPRRLRGRPKKSLDK